MNSCKYSSESYYMYNLDDLCPRHRLEMLKHQNENHSSAEQPWKEANYLESSLGISPCELTSSSNILFSHLCSRHRVELQQKRHNSEESREFFEEKQLREEEKSASNVPYAHDAKESCSICTKQNVEVCDNNDNSSSADSCDRDFDLRAKYEHELEQEVSGSKEDEQKHSEEKNEKECEAKKCVNKEKRTKLPIECIAINNYLSNEEHTIDCRQIDREQQSDKAYCKLNFSPLSKNASEEALYAKRHDNNVEKKVEERECNISKQVNCEVALLELSIPEMKYKRLSASNVNNNATTFKNSITNMCKDNCWKNEKMKEYYSKKCNNEDKDDYCQINNNELHIASSKGLRKEDNVSLQSSNTFVYSDKEEELLQEEKRNSVDKLDYKVILTNAKTDSIFRSTPSPYSALSPSLCTSKHTSEEHVLEMQHHISDRKPSYYFEQSITPLLPCEIPPRTCSAPTHPYDLFSEKVLPPLRLSHSHVKLKNYNSNINNNSNIKANTYINSFTRPSHKYNVKSQTEKNNHNILHQNARKSEIETEKASKHFLKSGETSMSSSLLSCTRLPLAPINENELVAPVHLHKKRSPKRNVELNNTVVNEVLNECKEHASKTKQTRTENIQYYYIDTNANKCSKNVQPQSTLSKENTSRSEEVKKRKHKKNISKATAHIEAVSKTVSIHTESDTQLKKANNIEANHTYCKSHKNNGAKLSQEKIADNQHRVTEHLICAIKEENNHTSKKICELSTRLSPWQSSSLQRVSHSIEFEGDYWQCLVEEFAKAVEDAAENDIAAAIGVTINSIQEVKCFCFPAKKFEESITEPSKHVVRKDDTQQSSECGSRCVVHFVVTCPHTWNKEQVYRLLDSYSFPNLWRLHDNLTCNDWLTLNKLPMEQKCEMQVLTLPEAESSSSCHVNERNKNVMLREHRNAINTVETRTMDTPENSNVNNYIKRTVLRRKTKNKKNAKGKGEENDDNDNGENIDSHANNTEMGECKYNADEKHYMKKHESINNDETTLRMRDEEENKCKANTVKENIELTEHVDSKNKIELCNLDGPELIHDLSTPSTLTEDRRKYNANGNEELGKNIECSPEPSNNVHIDAFSNEFEKELQKQQQFNEEQEEEENLKNNVKINCIAENKTSANDVELHTHREHTVETRVYDDFVDAGNVHTPRNKNYGIDSYINNSALSTPSHTSSYCTPTSRTHFASLIKFDSEEKVKVPKSTWGTTATNNDDNDDNTKFFFKAWSPLMDGSDNEISATIDNNINVSDDSCIKRIVAKEHEDRSTAHRLSSQNNKDENGMLENKQTNKQIPNRIVSSKTLSSSPSISSEPHLSSKLLTDATEEAFNISNEEHGQASLQKYSTSISQHKFTEPLPRHICICVEPYSKIHMVVFFGRQWENVLQQCKTNEKSVLKTVLKDMNDVVQSNLAKHHIQIHVNYITAESSSLIAKFTAICDDTQEDQICSTAYDGDNFNKCSQEVESLRTTINNSINASPMQHTWSLYEQFAKEYETAEQRTEICKSNTTIEHDSFTLQGMQPKLTLVSGEEIKRLTQPEAELKFTSYDVLPRLPVTRVCVEPSIEFAKHMTLHRSFASTNWEPLFSLVVIDEATAKGCFAAETKYMLRAKDCVVQSLQFAMCENVMSAAEKTDQAMSLTFLCLVEYDNIKCTREEQDKVNAYNYATLNKVVSEFYTLLSANIQTNANEHDYHHHHHYINSANSSFLLFNHAGKLKHNAQAVPQSHSSHSLSATEPTLSPSESAPASVEQCENAAQRRVIHDNMKMEYISNPDKCAINDNHSNSNVVEIINDSVNSKQNNTYIAINESAQRACSSRIESPYTCRIHRVDRSLESISPSPAPIPSPLPCANTSCNMMEQNEKMEEEEEEKVLLSTLELLRSKSNDEHLSDCRSGVYGRVENNEVSSARAAKIIPEIDDVHKFFDSESERELLNSSSETKCCKENSKGHRESREFVENRNRANSNRSEHSISNVRIIELEKEIDNGIANNNNNSSSSNVIESHCSILHPVESSTSSLFSDNNESDLRSMSNTSSHMVYFCAKDEPSQTNESYFVWDDDVNIVSDLEELLKEDSESILSMLTLSSSSPSELLASLLLEEMEVKTETTTSLQECLSADSLMQLYISEQESSELLEGNINSSAHTSKKNNKSHICKTATQNVNTKKEKIPLHNSSETKTGQAHSTKDSKTLNKKLKGNKNKKKQEMKKKKEKKEKNYYKNTGKEKQSTVNKRNKENKPKTSTMLNKKHNYKSIKWLRCVLHGSHWPAVEHLAEEELSSALCEDFMNATKCLPYKFVEGWGTARSDGFYTRYALEKKDLRMANVKVSSQQKTLLKKLEELEQEKMFKSSEGKKMRKVANNENVTSSNQSERKTHDNDWCDEEVAEITNYIEKYHFPCVWEVYHKFNLSRDERFSPTMSWNLSNRIKSTQASLSYGATLVAMTDDDVKEDFVNDEWTVHLENLQEMRTTELMEPSINNSKKLQSNHEQFEKEECLESKYEEQNQQMEKNVTSARSGNKRTCSKILHDEQSKPDKHSNLKHADYYEEQAENVEKKNVIKHTLVQEMESIGSDAPHESVKEFIEVNCESYQPDKESSKQSMELDKIVFGQAFTGQRWCSVVENDKDYLCACFIKDAANALRSYTHLSNGIFNNVNQPTYTTDITALAVKQNKLNVYYTVSPSNNVHAEEDIVKAKEIFKKFVCDSMQSYNFPLTWALHDLHFAEQVNSPVLSRSSSPISHKNKTAIASTKYEEKEQKTLNSNTETKQLSSSHKANSYVVEPEVKQTTTALESESEWMPVSRSKVVNTNDEQLNANINRNNTSSTVHKVKKHKVKSEELTSTEVVHTLYAEPHEQKVIKNAMQVLHEHCGSAKWEDENEFITRASSTRRRLENALSHSIDIASDGKLKETNIAPSPIKESSVSAAKVENIDDVYNISNDQKVAEIQTVEEKELEQLTPVDHMSHVELQKSARKKEECKRHTKKHTLRLAHVSKLLEQLDQVQKMAESFPNELNNAIKTIPDRLERKHKKYSEKKDDLYNEK